MPAVIDTRASKLDLTAPSGDDLAVTLTTTTTTWLDGETLSCPVETTKGVATGQSFTVVWNAGTLTLTLSDTQTTALGVGVYRWRLTGTEAGVTTTHIAGQLSLTAQSSATGTTSVSGTVTVSATSSVTLTVQGSALGTITDHLADTVDAHDASAISFTPTGSVAATDVQAAIAEVATDYLAANALLASKARVNGQQFLPTAAVAQTQSRSDAISNISPLSSGRLSFHLIWIPDGTYNSITFVSATTAATTPTNQWFAIYNASTRAKIAVTADDTSTAWAANTAKTLTISGGVTLTEGYYYVGIMVAAAAVPSLYGVATSASSTVNNLPPIVTGADTTNVGLTTPATAPATAAALTGSTLAPYAYVS